MEVLRGDEAQERSTSIKSCPDFSHDTLVPASDSKSQRRCEDISSHRDTHLAAEEGLTEKSGCREGTPVWPPWRGAHGWAGWGRENVSTMSLVPCLVVQAFSAGVLDATTYADFHTFASNRKLRLAVAAPIAHTQKREIQSSSPCPH